MATSQEQHPPQQQQQQPQASQEQPQEQPAELQPQDAPATVEPAAVAAGANGTSAKSFWASRRAALRANVANSGRRIVCTQAMALVTTTVLGMLCWMAFVRTDSSCSGGPVGLRSWYLGSLAWEFALLVYLFCMMNSVLSIWGGLSSPARRLADEEEDDEGACGIGLGFLLAFLALFIVAWSTLGLFADRDAGGCKSGGGYFWYIYSLMWITICCCHGGNTVDTYRQRHERAPAVDEIAV